MKNKIIEIGNIIIINNLIRLILIGLIVLFLNYKIKFFFINNEINNILYYKKYYISNNRTNENFNLIDINYYYSFKFNIIRIEYKIGFYDFNNNIILPSDLSLYKNMSIFCYIKIVNTNITIISYANIYNNNFYKCVEFYNINDNVNFGINIYQTLENNQNSEYIIYLFSERIVNYQNLIIKNDTIFDPFILNIEYINMVKKMNNINVNETLKLKKSYHRYQINNLKRKVSINLNEWYFLNLYNTYFCFCKGLYCLINKNYKKCKYYFYLNIIDNNKNRYNKTDYLFIDFIFKELSSDDTYPIFKVMINENLPAHYLTENLNIYNAYSKQNNKSLTIIFVNKYNYTLNGEFLEKYLTVFLKLKNVISNSGIFFNYINNLFYNIEYITYISVTHGVCYFKYFLYNKYDCYGIKMINKIVIPPSEKIILMAKLYGWSDNDIIKLNLPKWDKYQKLSELYTKDNKEILLMFTWREIKKGKTISSDYIKNIINLIKNESLNKELNKTNTLLYFALHHKIKDKYEDKIKKEKKYIKYIEQNKIAEYLSRVSLLVTDFSSIIFDIIYRKKPFIIFIPDANDLEIEFKYTKKYYQLIQSMKNGTIEFENKYFDINKTINKMIYYIENDFNLEQNLKNFYRYLRLNEGNNNMEKFVEYLKKSK